MDAGRDSKAEKASRNLKKRGEPTPSGLRPAPTRPQSSTSVAQSAATPYSRAGRVPELQMENTYQMAPSKKFPEGNVRSILKEVLTESLAEVNYDPNTCRQLTKSISDNLRSRVKEMNIQRYKIICLVHIGQLGKQAMRIGSRCLWDTSVDTYTSFEFKNGSIFAVATVYGVYFE
jgi:hypothetical protein